MDEKHLKEFEEEIKGFANRKRLAIVYLLGQKRELTVADIAKKINLSFKATSQHLRILDRLDVVDTRKESLLVYYRLQKPVSRLTKFILSCG